MYHDAESYPPTVSEDTPVNLRIRLSHQTVKALQARLRHAYTCGDLRRVRRISVLLEYLTQATPIPTLCQKWDVASSTVYLWLNELLLEGLDSLVYVHGGGRPAKLTKTQKKQLGDWIDQGPQKAGFDTACWNTVLLQELIRREFHVLYDRNYLCELLRNLGFSYQKAKFVSDHLDEARREAWRTHEFPQILKQAHARGAWLLFGDEASFPQWGSLSYTWARRGQTPEVKTAGKRKAYKVFGVIEYFSGQLFHGGIEGKFNSESYQAFLLRVMAQTTCPLILIQDGAKYHTSKATQQFFAQHHERLTVYRLPSYSPDYNPIEYLWRNTKKEATHNKYFEQFQEVIGSVEHTLNKFAHDASAVLRVFGQYCQELGLVTQPAN
jgi:transposase